MRFRDLFRMSSQNLKKRKFRTFLTVLGVVIGMTSIVVMISLGFGIQESVYAQIDELGGLNNITVTGEGGGGMMMPGMEEQKSDPKRLTDGAVGELRKLKYVTSVSPVLEMQAVLLKGPYEDSFATLQGVTHEGLKEKKLKLEEGGRLPRTGGSSLELLYGNTVITEFTEGDKYFSGVDGDLPDIDMAKDTIFLILDAEHYNGGESEAPPLSEDGEEGGGERSAGNAPKKYPVKASGVLAGGPMKYSPSSWNIYCDLETLKRTLKKEFGGRGIPGQPLRKSGKPYKDWTYTSVEVRVDDLNNVDTVAGVIREMGYNVLTNGEIMDSMKKQILLIQAVFGGIGGISLLVAAIGIANTMMMSIYERTKEIGVIKVLGCSLKNIKQMFLMEAGFVGLIGGVVGSILSYIISAIMNFAVMQAPELTGGQKISIIPFSLVLLALGFSILIGVVSGYLPALRAMKLSPLAAIRNE